MAKKSEIVKMDFMRKVKEFLENDGETVLQVKSGDRKSTRLNSSHS